MRRRSILVGVLALLAIVGGWLAWSQRDAKPTSVASDGAGTERGSVQTVRANAGRDPATGLPRWFGATGVAGKRIAGVVVGEDGKPVAAATVRLASAFMDAGLAPPLTKQTDASGRFDFGVHPGATYAVTAEMPKLTAALHRIDLRDPNLTPASDQLRLVLHPCAASIHGTVFDSAGGAIGGARLVRTERWVTSATGVEADASGRYELCVPAGGAGVFVTADGYAPVDDHVNVYGRTRRDFQLTPGASVVGRVVRAADKSPVAQAMVTLTSADPRRGGSALTAATDDDGRFAFDAVAPGRQLLAAVAEDLATQYPVDVLVELGGAPGETVLELIATYTVSGRVVEKGSQKPVAGRNVVLMASADRADLMRPPWSTSQADGTFAIDHVVPGAYTPQLARNRMVEGDLVNVVDRDVSDIVLETMETGSIAGRVLYDGTPVDGATVRDGEFGSFATSAADGTYVLRHLGEGSIKLYAESHRVGAFTNAPPVMLAAGEHKTGIDIVLDLSASISGVVVDQNDAPVAGVFVSFSLLRGRDFGNATTADDGSFTARSLSGGGDYAYEVKPRDQSPLVLPPAAGKRHPPIPVKDGQTHVTGVRIRVKYERLAISGRVIDVDGKPIVDAVVSAEPRESGWYRPPTTTSDQAGAFAINDLPAGTYTVRATTARGEAQEKDIPAGRTNVKLLLLEAGGIDGTLVGFAGVPDVTAYRIDDYFGRHRAVAGSTTPTAFQLRNLPAGRYQVTASLGGLSDSAMVEVMPAQVAKATLELGAVGTVTGRVVDAKGAPVAGVRCMSSLRDKERIDFGAARSQGVSDASGNFRIERASAGPSIVGCFGRDGASAWEQVEVAAGSVTNVPVTLEDRGAATRKHAGLTLEDQLDEVLVKTVEPNGAAARAGLAVGDALVTVDGYSIGRHQSDYAMRLIESPRGDAASVSIVVERGDKQLTLTLKHDAPGQK